MKKYGNEPVARTWGFQFRAFWMQLGLKVALFSHVVEGSYFKMAAFPLWEKRGGSSSGENISKSQWSPHQKSKRK